MRNITQEDKELILEVIKVWDEKVSKQGDYEPYLSSYNCIFCKRFLKRNNINHYPGSPACRKCPIVKISGSSCGSIIAYDSDVFDSSEYILTGLLLLAAAADIDVEKELL